MAHDDSRTWTADGPPPPITTEETSLPRRIGDRYAIQALIGSGGMGTVYRAHDSALDETVALKLLRAERVNGHTIARLRQEVRLARKVTHPNVVRVFDIGEHGDEWFLTMEYVAGQSLAHLIADLGRLPWSRAMELAAELCDGVQAAHLAGILHRDLKPDNVLLAEPGSGVRVKVSDFGIAVAANARGTGVAGTPLYMAPEQIRGDPVDVRTDVYGLGLVLFEMLTGRPAWDPRRDAAERLSASPPDVRTFAPDTPPTIAALVARCLVADPDERYPGVIELAGAFHDLVRPSDAPLSSVAARPSSVAKIVAIPPFRVEGGAPTHLAALGEELADVLSSSAGLRVRSIAAGEGPKGADAIVEGTIRPVEGGRLRLRARIGVVRDGLQIGAPTVITDEGGALSAVEELGRAVAKALSAEVTIGQASSYEADPQALELYLAARREARRLWMTAELGFAATLLQDALARAPHDHRIRAFYALVRGRQAANSSQWRLYLDEALDLATRAVELAPDAADGHVALGQTLLYRGDPVAGVGSLGRAARLAPGNTRAQMLLGEIALDAGRLEEARIRFEAALVAETEPASISEVARLYAYLGDWARVASLTAPTPDPIRMVIGLLARARFRLWSPLAPPVIRLPDPLLAQIASTVPWVAWRLRVATDISEGIAPDLGSRPAITDPMPRARPIRHQFDAEIYAAVGQIDGAVAAARAAVDAGLFDVTWLDRCPVLETARQRPEWGPLAGTVRERARLIGQALDRI